jgi:hypothetical protein
LGDVVELSDKDVRSRLLRIFAACRQVREAPIDEDRFLDHLVEPPAERGQIRDSFSSTRRYVRFIDAVQAEFAVYFSKKDWETSFSLDRFIERIQKLRSNPTGSIRSLKNAKASYDINVIIVANLVTLALASISHSIQWLFVVLIVFWVAMDCWIFWFYRREKKYLDELERKISHLRDHKS